MELDPVALAELQCSYGLAAGKEAAMQLHQRGVDLLVNLMDAEQHFDEAKPEELRQLISETIVVFG